MPRCGATFDEKSVPPWTRGDFRGVCEHGTPTTPAVAVGPGVPSSTEEGSSFSKERVVDNCDDLTCVFAKRNFAYRLR